MRLFPSTPPDITDRTVRRVWTLFIVLAVLVMLAGVYWLVHLSDQNAGQAKALEALETERAKISKGLDEQRDASAALEEQVKRLGGKPVVDPANPTAPPRALGPTDAQVKAAVADYCTGDRCAPTVSRSQVAAAVAAYCAGGTCRGKDGVGTDGQDGTDGTDGAPGPGPTADQIAAAVEAYCAVGNCRGDDGTDGTNGTDGKDGRSIESVQCDSGVGTFTFTYSDGTTQTVQCSPAGER